MDDALLRFTAEVVRSYENGENSRELNEWMMNPANFGKMRALVANPSLDPKVTHFGLIGIENSLGNIFHTLGCNDFLELSEWLLKLLFNEVDRFSATTFICDAACRTYARIVRLGWHTSPENFRQFFNNFRHFFEGSLKQRCMGIHLCKFIVRDMKQMYSKIDTEEMKAFQETTLFDCLNFATLTMQKALAGEVPPGTNEVEIVTVAQTAIQFVIEVTDDVEQADDLTKMRVKLCDEWNGKLETTRMAANMFETYERADDAYAQKLALEGLLRLSAVQSTKHKNYMEFWNVMLQGLSTVIERSLHFEDVNNITAFSNLLVNVKATVAYDKVGQLDCFRRLIDNIFALCQQLFKTQFLHDQPDTMENLLRFWDSLAQSFSSCQRRLGGEVEEKYLSMFDELSKNYVLMMMEFFEKFPDDARAILFDDLARIHPLIQFVTKVSVFQADVCYPKLHEMFVGLIEQFLNEPQNIIIEGQCCFLACSFLTALLSPGNLFAEAKINFYQAICNFIESTGSLVDRLGGGPHLTERVILCIIAQKKLPEMLVNSWQRNPQHVRGGADYTQLLRMYFARALLTLRKFPEEKVLIEAALDVLISYIQEKKDFHMSHSQPIISDLIDKIVNYEDSEQFRFLDIPANKRGRMKFNEMMAHLIDINKEYGQAQFRQYYGFIDGEIDRLKENLDARSDATESLAYSLMIDVRGLFMGIETRYPMLFDRFFPDVIDLLQNSVNNFPSLQLSYLKLLAEFVYNKGSRIVFDHHSANGLKMFISAARSLITYFSSVSSPEGYQSVMADPKAFRYAMRVMDEVLGNSCSNIGVLEVYGDDTLAQLFTAFLGVARNIDLIGLLQHPKVKDTLILLLKRLYSDFINQLLAIDWRFLCDSLRICETIRVDQDPTRSIHQTWEHIYVIIKKITKFCVARQSDPIGTEIREATKDLFNDILIMLEKMLFTYGIVRFRSSAEETTLQCPGAADLMVLVLRMQPTAWKEVKQRLSLFLQHSRSEPNAEAFRRLLSITY